MTVHATQLHVLPVNLKYLAYTLHTLHAQVVVEVLCPLLPLPTGGGIEFDAERIEVGLLGRPQTRMLHPAGEFYVCRVFRVEC